jgi:hypothetical protein
MLYKDVVGSKGGAGVPSPCVGACHDEFTKAEEITDMEEEGTVLKCIHAVFMGEFSRWLWKIIVWILSVDIW